jgi:hypothetical protein
MKQLRTIFTLGLLLTGMLVIAQDSTTRKELIGRYKFPAGSVVEEVVVMQDNGILMMNSTAGTSSLELVKGDTFNIVNFNGIAVFKRNETKKVIGVHIDASGYVLDGVKDSVAVRSNAMVGMRSFPSNQVDENDMLLVLDEIATKDFYRRRFADCIIE